MDTPTNKIWRFFFSIGTIMGCHQMPERSFFIKHYQFPVCARCTGVLIGYLLGVLLHFVIGTKILWCLATCSVMFLDWFLQYIDVKASTNLRRIITGIIGGYGTIGIHILCIKYVAGFL